MSLQSYRKYFLLLFTLIFSHLLHADEIKNIRIISFNSGLNVSWNALAQKWTANVHKDAYLGNYIPLLEVSVTTGDEHLISLLPNCYYRGTLLDKKGHSLPGTTVYLNICDNSVPFIGFVSSGESMFLIEASESSATGISMRLETTAVDIDGADITDTGDSGWKKGGSGGVLTPTSLYPRGNSADTFPSIDIYVNPSYVNQVGYDNYINRIIENLAAANTIYAQSGIKQLHLSAIVRTDQEISNADNQGNILHGLEKIRQYTVLPDGSDISIVYTAEKFSIPSLWGWSEIGYACDLEQAISDGDNINTHKIGQAASAIVNLPTLLQRAWIFAHEAGHTLGMTHVYLDPLAYGNFQPLLALKDYVAGCQAISQMYQTCAFDPQTKMFTDFYACN